MEARKNVVVVNEKGETLNTEHLIWDERSEKLKSDEFVKITRKDEIIPLSSMDALHQAASSPKQIMWYDSMHDLKSTAAIEVLAHDALT